MENENRIQEGPPPEAIDPLGEPFFEALTQEERRAIARFVPAPTWFTPAYVWILATLCRLWMRGLNRLAVEGEGRIERCRVAGRGLLTFSNHVSLFDDPLVLACLIRSLRFDTLRWIASDALNFFGDPLRGRFFSLGKCVPVVRGAGPAQPGIRFLADRLGAGDWIHVFPEGGRTRHPEGRLKTPLKPGMGLLVKESQPILLPFYHRGMHEVLPIGARIPRLGKRVSVVLGEPVDSREGLVEQEPAEIMAWAQERLLDLQDRAWGPEAG